MPNALKVRRLFREHHSPAITFWSGLTMVLVLLVMSCAPAPTPTPVPAPSPAAAPIAPVSDAELAWARVVDMARKERTLTLYSYVFTGQKGLDLAKAFQESQGIKIEIITGRGAAFIERIRSEARTGQVVGDLFDSSVVFLNTVKRLGLLASARELPVMREPESAWQLHPLSHDPGGFFVDFVWFALAPYINTNLVRAADEPRSWQDLLSAKWKGNKILLLEPVVSGGIYQAFVPLINAGKLPKDYVEKLAKQEVGLVNGAPQALEMLSRGEYPIAGIGDPHDAAPFIREGAPIKGLDMAEGVPVFPLSIGLIKGTPHPNAAQVFLNWLLSAEGQKVTARAIWDEPVRAGLSAVVPPAASVKPKVSVTATIADNEQMSKMLTERAWVPLFTRK